MNKLKIGIIFGGESSEHEVSCCSAASIIKNIDGQKYDLVKIWIDKKGQWYVFEGDTRLISDLQLQKGKLIPAVFSPSSSTGGLLLEDADTNGYSLCKLDCVFPIIHGTTGEDGVLQGLLELSHIPYVGCKTASSAVCMDKAITKSLLERHGIKQADWILLRKAEILNNIDEVTDKACAKFAFPMFIKPANTGSSVGVSKAYDREQLQKALECATEFDSKILVEEYIKGREIELAILDTQKGRIVSECGEIKPGSDFYDYDDKYKNGVSSAIIPADMPYEISQQARELAGRIFDLLDCRGFARCDFFLRDNQMIFNEINTLPGFTDISMYPMLMQKTGMSYTQLISELIEYALAQ